MSKYKLKIDIEYLLPILDVFLSILIRSVGGIH